MKNKLRTFCLLQNLLGAGKKNPLLTKSVGRRGALFFQCGMPYLISFGNFSESGKYMEAQTKLFFCFEWYYQYMMGLLGHKPIISKVYLYTIICTYFQDHGYLYFHHEKSVYLSKVAILNFLKKWGKRFAFV